MARIYIDTFHAISELTYILLCKSMKIALICVTNDFFWE